MYRKASFSYFLLFLVGASSKCPEMRKPHPTNCSLFYNCVHLPSGGHVWTPSKCSEGLVFESYLGICVLPSETWVCDPLSQASVIKQKQEELTEQSFDFTSKPLDLSETMNASHSLDTASDEGIRPQFENKTVVNNIIWFGRIITELLIYQPTKSPFNETLLVTNSEFPQIKTEYASETLGKKDNALNNFVTNYIFRNNDSSKNQNLNEKLGMSRNRTNYEILDTSSENKAKSVICNLNRSTESTETDSKLPSKDIIEIKPISGEKKYLTIENYEFLKNNLELGTVDVIPCSSGTRLPNKTSCTKYYICEANIATLEEFSCPLLTAFNRKTKICDTQTYLSCKKIKNGNLEVNSHKKNDENASLSTKKLCEKTGKFSDPNSSFHYYLCYSNNGKTKNLSSIRMMCPNNLMFCAERKICTRKRMCKKKLSEE